MHAAGCTCSRHRRGFRWHACSKVASGLTYHGVLSTGMWLFWCLSMHAETFALLYICGGFDGRGQVHGSHQFGGQKGPLTYACTYADQLACTVDWLQALDMSFQPKQTALKSAERGVRGACVNMELFLWVRVRSREGWGVQKITAHQILQEGVSSHSGCMLRLVCKPWQNGQLRGSFRFFDNYAQSGFRFMVHSGPQQGMFR